MAKLVPRVSDHWHADGMFTPIGGMPGWNWEVMDSETRFWLAGLLTEGGERTAEHAEAVLRRAREVAGKRLSRLTTDELPAYGAGAAASTGRGTDVEAGVLGT